MAGLAREERCSVLARSAARVSRGQRSGLMSTEHRECSYWDGRSGCRAVPQASPLGDTHGTGRRNGPLRLLHPRLLNAAAVNPGGPANLRQPRLGGQPACAAEQHRYFNSVVSEPRRPGKGRGLGPPLMAPGMGHCAGGEGPNTFDMVARLEAWVEQGKAPDLCDCLK